MKKNISWDIGGGNITLTYDGIGNGTISVESDQNNSASSRSKTITIQTTAGGVVTKNLTVTQVACPVPVGTIKNYSYTGTVQSVLLPAGKYKLQCWGAQGGTCSDGYDGGKGGYSEGVLTLDTPTTVYIFVGGQGSSSGNGGWNGGGGGYGSSSYSSGDEEGSSSYGCGGGATDIALVTSSMSYSSYRNNRSAASLLSRMIVAGGGSGGAYGYQAITTQETVTVEDGRWDSYEQHPWNGNTQFAVLFTDMPVTGGSDYELSTFGSLANEIETIWVYYNSGTSAQDVLNYLYYGSPYADVTIHDKTTDPYHDTAPDGRDMLLIYFYITAAVAQQYGYLDAAEFFGDSFTAELSHTEEQSQTTENSDYQYGFAGGGTSGAGYSSTYQGRQNAAGSNGEFGKGANNEISNYMYVSGCGGGGWYGGGSDYTDGTLSYIKRSGGGSGFVNTAANASYRPSGYTGIELDSGTTYDGNTSFPAPGGGNETGHSGDGYVRITRIS